MDTTKYFIQFPDNKPRYADKDKLVFHPNFLLFDKIVVHVGSLLDHTVKIFNNDDDITQDIITQYNENIEKTIEETNIMEDIKKFKEISNQEAKKAKIQSINQYNTQQDNTQQDNTQQDNTQPSKKKKVHWLIGGRKTKRRKPKRRKAKTKKEIKNLRNTKN
jgi:hypothetical protein